MHPSPLANWQTRAQSLARLACMPLLKRTSSAGPALGSMLTWQMGHTWGEDSMHKQKLA
jgi:hypothetical protein